MSPSELDLDAVWGFATALLIGALVGLEREKRKAAEAEPAIGGLRTFILAALVGAIAGWLSVVHAMPSILVAMLLVVAAAALAGYVLGARTHPDSLGLTTEVALVVVYLLGAMATHGHREIAVALAIVTAAVLAYKQPLHGLVDKIGWDDIFAGLRLLIATFIVLPLLPDRPVDPWGALNPYSLWLLVLLISSLSLVGYVGTRLIGADKGVVVTALAGGLVSSTAITLSFARESREGKATTAHALAGGILLAWCIMFGRVIAEVLVVNRALIGRVAIPFAAMGAIAALAAWFFVHRGAKEAARKKAGEVRLRNPFSLTQAARFAALFAAVLLLVRLVQAYLPGRGIYAVAALAGLTDVDAITLSMAEYAREGDKNVAADAIVIASLSNTIVKSGMVLALGGTAVRAPVLMATGAILAAGIAAMVLF
jgi:uncharacterized membrane protein (DUF4010 family)